VSDDDVVVMKWFKITLKGGVIESCEQVRSHDDSGRTIRYVEAESEAGARAIVMAWQRERELLRARNKRYYEEAKAAGICRRCHKEPAAEARTLCEGCLLEQRTHAREVSAGRHKPSPPKTPEQAIELFKGRRERQRSVYKERYGSGYQHGQKVQRREVLSEVRRKMEELTAAAFRAWLIEEHERAVAERPPQKKAAWRQGQETQGATEEPTEPGDFEDIMQEEIAKAIAAPRSEPRSLAVPMKRTG
jgi:hypothetical protein